MSSLSGSDDADVSEQIRVLPAYKPFFWLFAAIGVVLFYYSMGYAKKYSTMAAFLLPVRKPPPRSFHSLAVLRLTRLLGHHSSLKLTLMCRLYVSLL